MQPRDIIANGVNLPSLHTRRRHEHRQVSFAAGTGKRAANVIDFSVRAFDTDDEHMLCQPALFLTQLARNAQRQTFFRQKRIATVTRADAPNRVVLRIVTDKAPVHVEVSFGMQATREVIGTTQMVEGGLSHARHDPHVEHHIDAVRDLNSDFTEGRP